MRWWPMFTVPGTTYIGRRTPDRALPWQVKKPKDTVNCKNVGSFRKILQFSPFYILFVSLFISCPLHLTRHILQPNAYDFVHQHRAGERP